MYKIGDSVVYPMHGAGVIEDIEQKEILGKNQSYYVIRIPIGDMKVMVPMDNAQGVGMRDVIGKKPKRCFLHSATQRVTLYKTGTSAFAKIWSKSKAVMFLRLPRL